MKLTRLLYQTTRYKFKEFCKHCTLHGAYYFYDRSQRWVHAIWTLIIMASLTLCCFLSRMIWDKFAADPTLTVVETTRYSTTDIPFPAVSLCDTDPVYLPNANNITNLLTLRGYNESQVTEFYRSFTEVKKQGYAPKTYVRKMHSLLDDLGYPYKYLLYIFKRPCEDMIFECVWRSQEHNCSEMFRPVLTVVGYCCQYDINYFAKNSKKAINLYSGTHPSEALEITVEAKKVDDDDGGHVLLYSYDNMEKITLLTNPAIITPDSYFDVNIYLWTIDSSNNVKALSLDKRKCFLDTVSVRKHWNYFIGIEHATNVQKSNRLIWSETDMLLAINSVMESGMGYLLAAHTNNVPKSSLEDPIKKIKGGKSKEEVFRKCPILVECIQRNKVDGRKDFGTSSSTYEGCLSKLIMKQVVKACQCLPFDYTAEDLDVKELGECVWERLICVYENLEKTLANIRPIMAQSECYQRCDFVQYEIEVEVVSILKNLRKLDANRCEVSVHFSEATCIKYRREVLYTWDQMLANLGGIFGLCLGGSIISIIELIWFLIELTVTLTHQLLQKKKIKKIISKAEKNKIHVVNRDFNLNVKESLKSTSVMKTRFVH